MVAVIGVTVSETGVALVTVNCAVLLTVPRVAVIVTGVPATNWQNLAAEWRRLRRPVDSFIYEPVFVGSFEDAFCAAMVNPDIAAVIVNEGFGYRSRHDAPVLRTLTASLEKQDDQDSALGLAQALINDPDLVILDEPTSGLDPLGTRWMKDLIIDLKNKGKTVLMCSHRLEDVQDVCGRIAILYNGDLQTLGKVSTLVEDALRLEVRASGVKESPELKADLEAVFKKHGGSLETVGHPSSTLEELFLRVIEESKARPGRRYLPPEAGGAAGGGAPPNGQQAQQSQGQGQNK